MRASVEPESGLSGRVAVLLCDLDGVVRRWDPAILQSAERLNGLPDGAIARTAFADPLLHAAITGELSDVEWRDEITRQLERAHGPNARLAVQAWSAEVGDVDWRVVDLLREERRHRRVALISNATSRLESDLERLGIADEFDAVCNSSRLGAAKPSSAIFEAVCELLEVDPRQCALVDDTPGHVRAASALGMAGHYFRGTPGLEDFLRPLR